jgi:hypothetical protein
MAHRCFRKEDQVKCCGVIVGTIRSICNDDDVTAAVCCIRYCYNINNNNNTSYYNTTMYCCCRNGDARQTDVMQTQ